MTIRITLCSVVFCRTWVDRPALLMRKWDVCRSTCQIRQMIKAGEGFRPSIEMTGINGRGERTCCYKVLNNSQGGKGRDDWFELMNVEKRLGV